VGERGVRVRFGMVFVTDEGPGEFQFRQSQMVVRVLLALRCRTFRVTIKCDILLFQFPIQMGGGA